MLCINTQRLLDDEAKAQKFISVKCFEIHKTADFHSNLLVSWELVTEGYQGKPVKCVHFTHLNEIKIPLPGKVILWFKNFSVCQYLLRAPTHAALSGVLIRTN